MPMETWSVSTGTVDFVVGVDKKLWVGSELFKNFKSFFGTQGAVFGSKRFDCTDWRQQEMARVSTVSRGSRAPFKSVPNDIKKWKRHRAGVRILKSFRVSRVRILKSFQVSRASRVSTACVFLALFSFLLQPSDNFPSCLIFAPD